MPLVARLEPFLLHGSPVVRDSVGFHFFESWSGEEELVPLVLEACRRYGEVATLNLLSFGCRFPLSARGLIESLRALMESRPPFVEAWVSLAPLNLVKGRAELLSSTLSHRGLARLERRRRFHLETTTELWRRVDSLCRKLGSIGPAPGERDEVDDLLEALTAVERPESVAARVLAPDGTEGHLRWALVEIAGAMKLEELTEALVGLLGSAEEEVARASVDALARIGSADVVASISARYEEGTRRFRRFALSALKATSHQASGVFLADLAEREPHPGLRGRIFDALRFHFTERSEALLRRELERSTSWMIPEEIAKALFVFGELRGAAGTKPVEEDVYFHISFDGDEE